MRPVREVSWSSALVGKVLIQEKDDEGLLESSSSEKKNKF